MTDILDELDLGQSPRTLGRGLKEVYVEFSRDLSEADLAALRTERGVKPKSLMRIHASHHSLARCLATGMRPGQAGLVTGYSASRISILQADPAFQALVEDYRAEVRSITAALDERMRDVSLDAIEVLHERLQDSPSEFTVSMLLDVVKSFADRTGHGPGQEVHLKVDPNFIDRPPRENFEDWEKRRAQELAPPTKDLN